MFFLSIFHCRPMDDWMNGFIHQWRIAGCLRIKDISIKRPCGKYGKQLFQYLHDTEPY